MSHIEIELNNVSLLSIFVRLDISRLKSSIYKQSGNLILSGYNVSISMLSLYIISSQYLARNMYFVIYHIQTYHNHHYLL